MTKHATNQDQNTKPKRRLGKIALIAAVPGAFIIGAAAGAGGSDAEPTATGTVTETPEPVTETVTPEPEVVTETETKEVEVETVPQECIDALDDSETVNGYSGDAFSLAGDAIVAASEYDTATLNSITEEITQMKDEMDPYVDSYLANAGTCRDAAN